MSSCPAKAGSGSLYSVADKMRRCWSRLGGTAWRDLTYTINREIHYLLGPEGLVPLVFLRRAVPLFVLSVLVLVVPRVLWFLLYRTVSLRWPDFLGSCTCPSWLLSPWSEYRYITLGISEVFCWLFCLPLVSGCAFMQVIQNIAVAVKMIFFIIKITHTQSLKAMFIGRGRQLSA